MYYVEPYRRTSRYLTIHDVDTALNIADYGTSIAGVMGVNTTPADVGLFVAQAGRIIVDPYSVKKPVNEIAKLCLSGASIFFAEATGKKRIASAIDLVGKSIIDLTIKG